MRLPPPASSGAGLGSSLGRLLLPPALQSAGGLLRLLDGFIAGAPENDAVGHALDGDGDPSSAAMRRRYFFMRCGLISGPRWMRVASVDSDRIFWRKAS
jgi:hypothetical protein